MPDGLQRVERGAQRDDRRLVVGRGSRVDARLRRPYCIDPAGLSLRLAARSTGVNGSGCFQPCGIDRLAVVVTVEEQRPRRARHLQLAIDERIAGRFENLGREALARQQGAQVLGVAPDVRAVRRDVRNREQLEQLADDLLSDAPRPTRDARAPIQPAAPRPARADQRCASDSDRTEHETTERL